jgi:hypothetical protein
MGVSFDLEYARFLMMALETVLIKPGSGWFAGQFGQAVNQGP